MSSPPPPRAVGDGLAAGVCPLTPPLLRSWAAMSLSGPGRHERCIGVTRTHGESVRIASSSFSFHCWYGLAFQGLSPAQSRVPPRSTPRSKPSGLERVFELKKKSDFAFISPFPKQSRDPKAPVLE